MSYNSNFEADVKQAITSSNEELRKQTEILMLKDPLASYVWNLAQHENWSYERFTAVLINLLLERSEEWRQEMIDLWVRKSPAPILVTVSQERMDEIKKMAQRPKTENQNAFDRGPGC
jgi:hypothetical protein